MSSTLKMGSLWWSSQGQQRMLWLEGVCGAGLGPRGPGPTAPALPRTAGVMLRLSVGANEQRGSVPIPWLGGTVGQVIAIALMGLRLI